MRCYLVRSLATFAGLLLALDASALVAAEPLHWLPADINTVARLRVAEAFQSPVAKKEGWKKKASESFVHQESVVPPGTHEIIIGAQMDLVDQLHVHQKFGVLVPEGDLTLQKLADWLPYGVENVAGKDVAQFSDGSYVIDAGDGCWLSLDGSRQGAVRWLDRGPEKDIEHLSDYLQSALTAKVNTAPVMLAIDLQDNFSRDHVLGQLKQTDWFPSETAAEKVADILASTYGITINISFEKDRTGQVFLDFMKDATPIMPVLNNLVEAVLERVGAPIEEFTDWTWTVKGTRVTGSGPVSPGGARQLIAILDPPAVAQTISAASSTEQADDLVAKTSLKFCKSLQVLLDDVREKQSKARDNRALIVERYARKIDELPKLNVDDALIEYAANVSSSLRYQEQAMRVAGVRQGVQIAQSGVNYASYNSYVGPYGGWGWNATGPNTQGAEAIAKSAQQGAKELRFAEWKQIEDGLLAVRTAMTKKYQIEF